MTHRLAAPTAAPVLPPPVAESRGLPVLNGHQKAAIMVRLLMAEGAPVPLTTLPQSMQEALTEHLAAMRLIDRTTLRAVVEEFLQEMEEIGLSFPGGLEAALDLLGGQISPPAATRLRRMARSATPQKPWERVAAFDNERILALLDAESIEVGAVLLSKLSTVRAAEVLGLLPGERARRIAYAVSLTAGIDPDLVERIGESLAGPVVPETDPAFSDTPVDRIGAILNSSAAATRDEVLRGLDADDADFARRVRKAIFTYTDIPDRLPPRDVPRIIRGLDQTVLVQALADRRESEAKVGEFILANISQRLAASLREERDGLGRVKDKDAERAQSALVALIRDMQTAGEITLISEEEE